ncbi:MAG: ATPase, partial [Ruminiclostridium sp.]|nr:ATPase [Ruminiclostridium sp.]
MDIKEQIFNGNVSIGIEFGSTRIKAVLTGQELNAVAVGTYDWENKLENGIWTYSQDDIINGLKGVYASLRDDVERQYGVKLDKVASIGISAMMHGYLAFDENDNLLVPFRTWRNTMTAEAADELTEVLGFNIPQRWSIAHLWQAILNKEPHVPKIRFFTTL